ncbi:MAG: hypothetical protein GC181_13460 [Bacteroidetes bacterium]|nr:hypothetical protein [Bacteroidota bacterium]
MIWAIVSGEKVEALPKTKGICPACQEPVFSKCGETNIWHWSHFKKTDCDLWNEPESLWHKQWKLTFGKDNNEIRIDKDGKWHIADVLTNNKVIIELQNSLISKTTIREREEFYGERMIWLINGASFKQNLIVKDFWEDEDYRMIKSLPQKPVRWIRKKPEIIKGKNDQFFDWKRPRRSWIAVERHIFIDFNCDKLFWVKEGMGTNQIRGTYIAKTDFIKKYGGNYEYYNQHSPCPL